MSYSVSEMYPELRAGRGKNRILRTFYALVALCAFWCIFLGRRKAQCPEYVRVSDFFSDNIIQILRQGFLKKPKLFFDAALTTEPLKCEMLKAFSAVGIMRNGITGNEVCL